MLMGPRQYPLLARPRARRAILRVRMGKYVSVRPRVHQRGNRRLDAVIDLVAFAARPMPLSSLLDEAPRRIASLLGADVCSLYLVEGDRSALVMRGNVGFTNAALGKVRLRVGGDHRRGGRVPAPHLDESARPARLIQALRRARRRRFPRVFLAVPILGKSGPLGALVVQRKDGGAFEDRDVELLTVTGGSSPPASGTRSWSTRLARRGHAGRVAARAR